jgi:hypothetical protein
MIDPYLDLFQRAVVIFYAWWEWEDFAKYLLSISLRLGYQHRSDWLRVPALAIFI